MGSLFFCINTELSCWSTDTLRLAESNSVLKYVIFLSSDLKLLRIRISNYNADKSLKKTMRKQRNLQHTSPDKSFSSNKVSTFIHEKFKAMLHTIAMEIRRLLEEQPNQLKNKLTHRNGLNCLKIQ